MVKVTVELKSWIRFMEGADPRMSLSWNDLLTRLYTRFEINNWVPFRNPPDPPMMVVEFKNEKAAVEWKVKYG